jgi:hypothetical protein
MEESYNFLINLKNTYGLPFLILLITFLKLTVEVKKKVYFWTKFIKTNSVKIIDFNR